MGLLISVCAHLCNLSDEHDDEEVLPLGESQAVEQGAYCVDQVGLLLTLHCGDAQHQGH